MDAVMFIRVDDGQQGSEMIQVQLLNGLVKKHEVNIVGYCIKIGSIPVEEILPIIQSEVKKSFNTIFIYNKDIISPNIKDVFKFVNHCAENGIEIYTVTDGNLTDFVLSLMEVKMEHDTKKLSTHTVNRMAEAAAKGRLLGGRVAFGYQKRLDGYAEVIPQLVPVVREIFQMYADGCSPTTIARVLADKYGLHYNSPSRGRWRQDKILRILKNPIYNGYPAWRKTTQRNKKLVQLPEEEWIFSEKRINELVIIEDRLWTKVQQRLKKKSND